MNFKLRPFNIDDVASLVVSANNPKIAANMTDAFPFPYMENDARSFIERVTISIPVTIFAIDINGNAVGGIGLHPQTDVRRKNAELGYWLAEKYWGQGIITEAIKQMVEFGFNDLGLNRIFARPYGGNKASQRVLEKSGFTLEATFKSAVIKEGKELDELVYSIRK